MSVTRGAFLKSLGKSLPGMVLGSGVAVSAQKLLAKMSAAAGEPVPAPTAPAKSAEPKPAAPEFIYSGPANGNRIALTFDDGPTPGVTDRILDELKQRDVRATFFMIGKHIVAAPDLARRVLAEGHVIGNHTFTHPKLSELPDARAADEIQRTQDIMGEVLGQPAAWFRPPFGALRQDQAHLVNNRGMRIVMWSIDTRDWSLPGDDQIVACVLDQAAPGAIVLCHDVYVQTANAIGPILDNLLACGLTPVTLPRVMAT